MTDQKCLHENFHADVNVGRLQMSEEDKTIIGYCADIHIYCLDCGLPFEFVGVECGLLPDRPTASPNFQELRVPLLPKGEQLPQVVRAGFVVRPILIREDENSG